MFVGLVVVTRFRGDLFAPFSIHCQDEDQFLCCLFGRLSLFPADARAEGVALRAESPPRGAASYASAHISGVHAAIGKSPSARGKGWLPHLLTPSSFQFLFVLGLWKIFTFLLVW